MLPLIFFSQAIVPYRNKFKYIFNLTNYHRKTQPESFCFLSLTNIGFLDENISPKKVLVMFPQSMLLSHISYVVSYFMDIVVLFPHVSFASRHYCRHEPAIYSPIYMFLSFFFLNKLFSLGRGKLITGNLDRYLLDRIKIEKKSTSNRHQKPTAYLYNTCVHLKKLNYNCR